MAEDARLRVLVGLTQAVAAARDRGAVADVVVRAARKVWDPASAQLSTWEREGDQDRLRVLAGDGADQGTLPVEEAAVEAPRDARAGGEAADQGSAARMAAPVVSPDRAWGVLTVARATGEPVFDHGDREFATVLAAMAAAGFAQVERFVEVRRLAFTDPLTGLANRRAVDARLDEALARHRAEAAVVSLVICDVNGLKGVNDAYGHAVGDLLLERFGAVLARCGAELSDALVARLGGDEFCLLAVGPSPDEVVRAAGEVCRRAAGLELGEGVACGMASTGDAIGPVPSARRLFRLADAAQYRAKATRSDQPVVAGRQGGREDPVVRLADAPGPTRDRRRFRGEQP